MIKGISSIYTFFMKKTYFFIFIFFASNLSAEDIDIFELSLEELMKIEVDLSGQAVKNLDFSKTPKTANPQQLPTFNIAASIEIMDKKNIEARGLKNVVEVVEGMTGVISGESPSEPYSFSMRGFNRDSVKVLYNGISMGLSILNMRPQGTNHLASVEAIKGPAILFGEGTVAGTINLITKKPELSSHHLVKGLVSYGSYNSSSINMNFSGPIDDNVAYQLDLSRRSSDGWVDNSASESIDLSASLLWQISSKLDVIFSFSSLNDELPAYWGTPLVPRSYALKPVDLVKSEQDLVIDEKTRFNNYNVADHVIDSASLWATIEAKFVVSDEITSHATLYHFSADRNWRNAETYNFYPDTQLIERDRLLVEHDRDLFGINAGFNLNKALFNHKNQFSFDIEYSDNDFSRVVGFEPIDFFVDFVDFHNPQAGFFDENGEVEERDDFYNQKTLAVILKNNTEITQRLNFDLGVRFENIKVERARFNFDGSLRVGSALNKSFKQLSYQASLSYSLTEKIMTYAQYNLQHSPIEGDFSSSFFGDALKFEPSDVSQVELGLKGSFYDDDLELTLALYDIEKSIAAQLPTKIRDNIHTSQGLEISSRLRVNENFRLGGNIAFINAELEQFYNGTDVSGNTPENVPDLMWNLWASYNNLFDKPIEVGASINYVGDRFTNADNLICMQDYTLVNMFIAYTLDNYRIALHGRNLTDEIYAPWSDINYPSQLIIAPPRTVELSFRAVF